jgi:hypothetical protein
MRGEREADTKKGRVDMLGHAEDLIKGAEYEGVVALVGAL